MLRTASRKRRRSTRSRAGHERERERERGADSIAEEGLGAGQSEAPHDVVELSHRRIAASSNAPPHLSDAKTSFRSEKGSCDRINQQAGGDRLLHDTGENVWFVYSMAVSRGSRLEPEKECTSKGGRIV